MGAPGRADVRRNSFGGRTSIARNPIHPTSRTIAMEKREEKKGGKFRIETLEERIAPAITTTHVNGGGNTPNGNANGVPTVSTNPAGHAPPGQNA